MMMMQKNDYQNNKIELIAGTLVELIKKLRWQTTLLNDAFFTGIKDGAFRSDFHIMNLSICKNKQIIYSILIESKENI